MTGLEQFEKQSFLSLQTYRKSGEAMPTPVWFVQDGEKLYIRTVAGSGKVKRIRNNPNVQIMPCGSRGEPFGTWLNAQAHEVLDEATFAQVKAILVTKYGEQVQAMEDQAQGQGQKYTVIVIEPQPA